MNIGISSREPRRLFIARRLERTRLLVPQCPLIPLSYLVTLIQFGGKSTIGYADE